jgi:hypothetical protein
MNTITEVEAAWLAGLYEGEGHCSQDKTSKHIRVVISMTDFDIINRVYQITGIGSVKTYFSTKNNHKPIRTWYVGSRESIEFLKIILPWLGERRKQRALECINIRSTSLGQSRPTDSHCIHGHSYEFPNGRDSRGTCRQCKRESDKRYRDNKSTSSKSVATKGLH